MVGTAVVRQELALPQSGLPAFEGMSNMSILGGCFREQSLGSTSLFP
ncbi:MAG: hypothetical protein NZ602_02805 [Thermoguttaceae bacterium]|nr:hypothetical protein [Thermoguttaceae bacterium]MDW8036764.1 hypothetical protein [Thermoguttaceae bacterium]